MKNRIKLSIKKKGELKSFCWDQCINFKIHLFILNLNKHTFNHGFKQKIKGKTPKYEFRS